ncbi:MAG: acetyl-CoA carboxylase, carboxyltransferase subunit beta [Clostridioides sp.]|jgi:acetyl-CoA carboxylase carboxyl transferase subunit beta|nr:acetyl-CoA carboxylase, carboxyltransferase subunit beta [Clostridioides sp.]
MIKKFLSPKESKYVTISLGDNFKENDVNDKFWLYCDSCKENLFRKDVEENLYVCPKCGKHFSLKARNRIKLLIDNGTFVEFEGGDEFENPLNFPDYENKHNKYMEKTGEKEAVITGYGRLNGIKTAICVMNPEFMMGSMGAVVGEKITSAIEYAADNNLPMIICSASGGARMQEGMISLMQMAKTSQALAKLEEKSLPYISILTDPTTGGVTASFAMLGDINISEPNTLIGFAGPRVIEQTINQKLPEGFQTAEFLLEHGFLDMIVDRRKMKEVLYQLLSMHR